MLFFRSEERVAEWCQENRTQQRPLVSLSRLWKLAVAWYSNRLSADAKRPSPDEIREVFTGIGLTGPFWDPEARG